MEDIRIGREMYAGSVQLALDGTDQSLLSQNPKRTVLILTPPSAGKVTYHYGSSIEFGAGIVMCAGESPMILEIGKHGQLVTRAWRAIGIAGDSAPLDAWFEVGVGTAVAAVAIHAAVAGRTHIITDIWASADDATLANDLTFNDGVAAFILGEQASVGNVLQLKTPLRGNSGTLVSLTLANVAAVSRVFMAGYSIGTSEGFGNIVVYEASLDRQ